MNIQQNYFDGTQPLSVAMKKYNENETAGQSSLGLDACHQCLDFESQLHQQLEFNSKIVTNYILNMKKITSMCMEGAALLKLESAQVDGDQGSRSYLYGTITDEPGYVHGLKRAKPKSFS